MLGLRVERVALYYAAWLGCLALLWVSDARADARVFYDGAEQGNTDLWPVDGHRDRCTSVTSSSDGRLGPFAGTRMLRCNSNGTVEWNTPEAFETLVVPRFAMVDEVFYRVRVRIDENHDLTMGSAKKILRLFGDNDAFAILWRQGAGIGQTTIIDGNGPPTYWGEAPGDTSRSTDAWHSIEFYFNRATGSVRVWRDDILVQTWEAGPFSSSVGENGDFYLTSNFSDPHDATNHVYFDDFEIFSDADSGTPIVSGTMLEGEIVADASAEPFEVDTLAPGAVLNLQVH